MTVERMDHVGIVVDDLDAAAEFFAAIGLELGDKMSLEGTTVDRIVALEGARSEIQFARTPDGHAQIELTKFHAPPHEGETRPPASNEPGIRHITFAVDDIDATLARVRALGYGLVGELEQYETSYRLCYVRGPAGIIVELAEKLA